MAITSATSQSTVNSVTSTITLPASVATGDMLIAIAGLDVGAGASTNAQSFTELKDETGTDVWAWIGYKIAAGGETSCVLTHTTERSNNIAYRIPAAEWHGTTVPEITAVGDGTSINPNPPSITPSWGAETGTTFIAIAIRDDSTVNTVSAYPTNYTANNVDNTTATSAASVAAAIRIASSSPEDPGTFTISASEHWRTYTIAIRGAVAAISVTPGKGTLTLTTFAPVVTASDHKSVTPTTAVLVTSRFAPTVTASDHKSVTPATAALTLATFAPVVTAGAGLVVTPTKASLALTAFAPNVILSDHKLVTPTTKALALSAFAPTVTATAHQLVTPTTAALMLAAFAPTVTASGAAGPSRLQVPIGNSRGRPVTVRMPYG